MPLLALAVSACASRGQRTSVAIRVVDDTVRLVRSPEGTSLSTSAVIRNDATRPLYYDRGCGPTLQREMKGSWQRVWDNRICLDVVSSPVRIAPGDSVVIPAQFLGFTIPNHLPGVDPRVEPGLYRLVFGVGFELDRTGSRIARYLREDQRSTVPFVVRDTVRR